VGIAVRGDSSTPLYTSASFGYGVDHFTVPALHTPGSYTVTLDATDLAGNYTQATGTVTVRR
jgi:hypothetical protein